MVLAALGIGIVTLVVVILRAIARSKHGGLVFATVFSGVLLAVFVLAGLMQRARMADIAAAREQEAELRAHIIRERVKLRERVKQQLLAEAEAPVEMQHARGSAESSATEYVPQPADGLAWTPAAELGFDADIYPSAELAVRALARQAVSRWTTHQSESDGFKSNGVLLLIAPMGGASSGLVERVARAAEAEFTDAEFLVDIMSRDSFRRHYPTDPAPGEADVVFLHLPELRSVLRNSVNGRPTSSIEGIVQLASNNQPWLSSPIEASFVNKPWLAGYSNYVARPQNAHHLLAVSDSREAAVDQAEAKRQALRNAAQNLLDDVERKLNEGSGGILGYAGIEVGQERLLQLILDALSQDETIIIDRFSQSFERPYGRLWRMALLIDASPTKVAQIAGYCRQQLGYQRTTWASLALSIIGLVGVIGLTYAFLNVATRGYYTLSLRLMSTALMVAGVACVILFWA
jgi:hypothetical protein